MRCESDLEQFPDISPSDKEVGKLRTMQKEFAKVDIIFEWIIADHIDVTPLGYPYDRQGWRHAGACKNDPWDLNTDQ